jgi:hypothetical protein
MKPWPSRFAPPALAALVLAACAAKDSATAERARQRFLGMSEVDLQSCLGAPDQHSSFGSTDVLTYIATSQSGTSFSLPVVGGIGFSNGAYCRVTFRVEQGRVTRVLYSGEKNATGAPDAYCAPIVRSCLSYLDKHPNAGPVAPPAAAPAPRTGGPEAASAQGVSVGVGVGAGGGAPPAGPGSAPGPGLAPVPAQPAGAATAVAAQRSAP